MQWTGPKRKDGKLKGVSVRLSEEEEVQKNGDILTPAKIKHLLANIPSHISQTYNYWDLFSNWLQIRIASNTQTCGYINLKRVIINTLLEIVKILFPIFK